jgi:PAS domain S-box-containing protein
MRWSKHVWLAWAPLAALLLAMIALWITDSPLSFESHFLILVLNFLFSTLVSLYVAYLISRSFLARGSLGLLLLGCGIVSWGSAGVVANVVSQGHPNLDVTIHNLGVWLSALFHLAGASVLLSSKPAVRVPAAWLSAAYVGAFGAVGVIALLALHGYTPAFFVPGEGGTLLRQLVLSSAIGMFLLTALLTGRQGPSSAFTDWYALALIAIAVGLLGILLQSTIGGLLPWVGRTALYLGGVYMLLAALASVREAKIWGIPLEESLRQATSRLAQVFESISDGFVAVDARWRYTYVNSAAERIFGKNRSELLGKTVWEVSPEAIDSTASKTLQKASAERTFVEFEDYNPGMQRWFRNRAFPDADGGICVYFHDITKRKQSEERLRQSEQQLRRALEAGRLGCFERDIATNVVTADSAHRAMWGLDSDAVVTSDAIFKLIHPDDVERVKRDEQAALTAGHQESEFRIVRPDGEIRWLDGHADVVRGSGGEAVKIVGLNVDITERKHAERDLRDSEARLRLELHAISALQALSAELTQQRDLKLLLQAILAAAAEITGTDKGNIQTYDEMSGTLRILLHQGLGQRMVEHFADDGWVASCAEAVRQSKRVIVEDVEKLDHLRGTVELEIVLEDGIRAIVCTPLVSRDGRLLGMLNNHYRAPGSPDDDKLRYIDLLARQAADLIERTQAEEALRAAQQHLGAELDGMTRLHALSTRLLCANDLSAALNDLLENAVVACKADFGNIQLYNRQAEALEIIAHWGFGPDFLDHFRTVRVEDGSACAEAMQLGERIVIEDVNLDALFEPHRAVAAAAGFRAVQSTPLKNHWGAVIGMLSTHFRTTHRPSERDTRLLDLYARHAADLIERMRMEQSLRDADRRKDEFLATLAHELRNPLAPLRNAVELLRLADGDKALLDQTQCIMDRQVSQMVRLVDDLLDISRITTGKLHLRKETVELADVLNAAVETVRPLIEATDHELTVAMPPRSIRVHADPTRLAQVFLNLLSNAVKYTDKSGHIWLTAERRGNQAVVAVRDTGIGIASEHLASVFEMFSQVTSALERSQGGLGIGLSLVKGLVELHGGTIEARSGGPGLGSEFNVSLPIVDIPIEAPHKPSGGEEVSHANKRSILVVDDLRDSADSMAMMLRMMGHETRTAYDGLEAVQTAAAFQPNIVLLDIGLPKLNGYEVARHIREQPWGGNVALVALTGWGQEEDRRLALEAGFDHHLTKPVEAAPLEKLLAGLTPVPHL